MLHLLHQVIERHLGERFHIIVEAVFIGRLDINADQAAVDHLQDGHVRRLVIELGERRRAGSNGLVGVEDRINGSLDHGVRCILTIVVKDAGIYLVHVGEHAIDILMVDGVTGIVAALKVRVVSTITDALM